MRLLSNGYAGVAVLRLDAGETATIARGDLTVDANAGGIAFDENVATIDGPCAISIHTHKKAG